MFFKRKPENLSYGPTKEYVDVNDLPKWVEQAIKGAIPRGKAAVSNFDDYYEECLAALAKGDFSNPRSAGSRFGSLRRKYLAALVERGELPVDTDFVFRLNETEDDFEVDQVKPPRSRGSRRSSKFFNENLDN